MNNFDKLHSFDFETVTVNRRGEIIKRINKSVYYFMEKLPKNVTLEMLYIPGGKFVMGCSGLNGEKCEPWESPEHVVRVESFFMGKFVVSQKQWKAVVSFPKVEKELDEMEDRFSVSLGDDKPAIYINWYMAVEFCQRLFRYTGRNYRLPSEAEWEYACRAGTTTPFHFGETLTAKLANYNTRVVYAEELPSKHRETTTSVGKFPPNAFGLYDMHGNVWEWCADDWISNYKTTPRDGSPYVGEKKFKVRRGGSGKNQPKVCRSAFRHNQEPDYCLGSSFRIACDAREIFEGKLNH